jgi:hypothetical protein
MALPPLDVLDKRVCGVGAVPEIYNAASARVGLVFSNSICLKRYAIFAQNDVFTRRLLGDTMRWPRFLRQATKA